MLAWEGSLRMGRGPPPWERARTAALGWVWGGVVVRA